MKIVKTSPRIKTTFSLINACIPDFDKSHKIKATIPEIRIFAFGFDKRKKSPKMKKQKTQVKMTFAKGDILWRMVFCVLYEKSEVAKIIFHFPKTGRRFFYIRSVDF